MKLEALWRYIERRACVTSLSLASLPCRRSCRAWQHVGHLASVVQLVRMRLCSVE